MLSLKSAPEVAQELAKRIRARRLQRGWTQGEMARRTGIKVATYVLFERTGRISLVRLLKVFDLLGLLETFDQIARDQDLSTLTIKQLVQPTRQRGSSPRT